MKRRGFFVLGTLIAACAAGPFSAAVRGAEMRSEVSQFGITWKFDQPRPVGQFVNGDYWVVGPVTVTQVTPDAGPASEESVTAEKKNQFGDDGLQNDRSMRNGSMIVAKVDKSQGYDSRLKNYDRALSQKYPLALKANDSLISTISNEQPDVPTFVHEILWKSEKRSRIVLKSAAILTCLDKEPPSDAFRPAYAGTEKILHRAGDMRWDLLPKLKPAGDAPDWALFERYLERPWLDHAQSWLFQLTGPSENQPSYGREFSRVVSTSSLLLSLDVPKEKKQKLAIRLVQLGIDMQGLMKSGRAWSADGGHWSGRKWPVLFAGLLLGDKGLQTIPRDAIFQEDQQTYYGQGFAGQAALYQMVSHHGPRAPYEEKSPEQWDAMDKRSESYRLNTTAKAWIGTALVVQLMQAKALWNHDAYFDYCDRWMAKEDAYASKRNGAKRPSQEGSTFEPFTDAMWHAYRERVPEQAGGSENRKWVWKGNDGQFVPNASAGK